MARRRDAHCVCTHKDRSQDSTVRQFSHTTMRPGGEVGGEAGRTEAGLELLPHGVLVACRAATIPSARPAALSAVRFTSPSPVGTALHSGHMGNPSDVARDR